MIGINRSSNLKKRKNKRKKDDNNNNDGDVMGMDKIIELEEEDCEKDRNEIINIDNNNNNNNCKSSSNNVM